MGEKKKSKVVTAPLVLAARPDGTRAYLYRGAVLEGLDSGEVKRLEELGMVGDVSEDIVVGVGVGV